jgi:hypothetical protein
MDREHDETRLHGDETPEPRVTAFELLADESVADAVHAGAVVALDRAAEQPEPGNLGDEVCGKLMLLECFAHHGDDLVVDEAPDRVLDHEFFFGEFGADVVEIERI